MKDQDFQRTVSNIILRKRWEEIKANWISYVKEISPPGSAQSQSLSGNLALMPVCDKLIKDPDNFIVEDADFVREIIFRDAIFSLHKAANIISNAQNNILKGYKTWSLVNAYHGS